MNSRAEYNCCFHVARIRLERKVKWEERLEENKGCEESKTSKLDEDQVEWERKKTKERKRQLMQKIEEKTVDQEKGTSTWRDQ